ncbi:MAG: site-specific integrase [Rectinemataceae bacterium]
MSLAFLSGLRRGEPFGVERADLDFEAKTIDVEHVWKSFGSAQRVIGRPKWDKVRTAPLADMTIDVIKALETMQGKHERIAVFPDGRTPSESWWTDHVAACLKRAGIEIVGRNIVPHSARHSIASALYARGTPFKYLQDMFGHSDMSTTDIYIHTPADAIDAMTAEIDRATAATVDMSLLSVAEKAKADN